MYSRSMKRFSGILSAAFALAVIFVIPVAADVNDFVISDYEVQMKLGVDAEGRSTLKTTETITAEFPKFDQNHGLERAIPKTYDGHTTNVKIVSVTDKNNTPRAYSTYDDSNGNLVVRMADMDVFVHGTQVYTLTYTQQDVTKAFGGRTTAVDEFYWDINGTDWRVPIESLSTTLSLEDGLLEQFNSETACYQGYEGSTTTCPIDQKGKVFTSRVTNLSPGQNVTIAIGFLPQTFTPYQMTAWEQFVQWWLIAQFITFGIALFVVLWLVWNYSRASGRDSELGPIAPEYLPPKDASITIASQISNQTKGSVMTAQLLDLAVRHYIRLYEVKEKKWYRAAEYEVEIIKDPTELRAEEAELLKDMFGRMPSVGDTLNMKKLRNNTAYFNRTQDNDKQVRDAIRGTYGLRQVDQAGRKRLRKISLILAIVAVLFILSIPLFVVAIVAFILSYMLTPLTDKGLDLRRYLLGLKLYIGVAEQERLRMLQSPDGAEKIATLASGTDQASLIKLYERVLPYAVLFGQEKQWTKQLGAYYEQANTSPDWYAGRSVFNAVAFSSAMSGLGQAASYASSSSSSTGGSSGGGSSGGGGGGGGGGGV